MCPDESVKSPLPDHLEERTSLFRTNLHQVISNKKLHNFQIGSVDELFLHLTPSAAKEQRHCSVGLLKNSGFPAATATVLLCATADGNLLPPLLIFKVYIRCIKHLNVVWYLFL